MAKWFDIDTDVRVNGSLTSSNSISATSFTENGTTLSSKYLGINANATSASKWQTGRKITLGGDATGNVTIDGSSDVTLTVTVTDDSHAHIISNVDGLQTALDDKLSKTGGIMTGNINFSDDVEGITWSRNTDGASIKFKNTSDADADSYLEFNMNDNGNEYFKWTISSGATPTEVMTLKTTSGNLWTKGSVTASSFVGNASSASKLETARTISLTGDVSGSGSFDGSGNLSITTTVADDSHNHIIDNIDGLQTALDGKLDTKKIDFTVGGDANTYYPVVVEGTTLGSNNMLRHRIEFYRMYSETAPDTWNTATHKGGLQLIVDNFLYGWGGQQYYLDVQLGQSYSKLLADVVIAGPDTDSIIVWLRGGGASYHALASDPDTTVTVYIGDYVNKPGTQYERTYSPKTSVEPFWDVWEKRAITTPDLYLGGGTANIKGGKKVFHEGNFDPSSKLDVNANAVSASKLQTARTIALTGDVTGSGTFDGSGNLSITTTVADDSHAHIISNVDGLQSALDGKASSSHSHTWDSITGKPTAFTPSAHDHATLYYSKTELSTSGSASVHWGNITNVPTLDAGTLDGLDSTAFVKVGADIVLNAQGRGIIFGEGAGLVGYIRRGTEGQIDIGSDDQINIYETDENALAIAISTNDKTLDAKGGLKENGVLLSSKYLGIGAKASDSEKLDNLDSSQFIRSDTSDTASGNHEFYATDTTGVYSSSAIEIREVNVVGSAQTAPAYAPALAFHWGGRVQTQLALESTGVLTLRDGASHNVDKTLNAGNLQVQGNNVYHAGNLSPVTTGTNQSTGSGFTIKGTAYIGDSSASGDLVLKNGSNVSTIHLDGDASGKIDTTNLKAYIAGNGNAEFKGTVTIQTLAVNTSTKVNNLNASLLNGIAEEKLAKNESLVEIGGYGVATGLGATAQSVPNMSVKIGAGTVYTNTGRRVVIADTSITVSTASTSYDRYDIIYVQGSSAGANEGKLTIVAGTPTATPVDPAIPSDGVPIARVRVPKNIGSITDGSSGTADLIDDIRMWKPVVWRNNSELYVDRIDPNVYSSNQSSAVFDVAIKNSLIAKSVTITKGSTSATWTHNLPFGTNYAVQLSCNSSEPHLSWSNKTSSAITVNLDDVCETDVIVDITIVGY